MSNEEIIELINKTKEEIKEEINKQAIIIRNLMGEHLNYFTQVSYNRNLPKKPTIVIKITGEHQKTHHLCPTCENDINETHNFCDYCGQRLNWWDNDDE